MTKIIEWVLRLLKLFSIQNALFLKSEHLNIISAILGLRREKEGEEGEAKNCTFRFWNFSENLVFNLRI